jgi:pimeloyl-ACP methyl ester carboxylesterase
MTKLIAALTVLGLAPASLYAEDKFFDSNGAKIRYVEQGSGEAIVLVHGRNGSAENWTGIIPDLSKDYRVIALDCRGHGQSSQPRELTQYGRQMSLDIVRLLDHLGIKQAHIVGYSMGAAITSHLLTLHPERFLTATLGGSAGRFNWTPQDTEMFEQQAVETEKWGFSPSAREQQTGVRPSEAEIRERSAALLANPNRDRLAMAAVIRSFRELAVTPAQIRSLKVPMLGLAGSNDPNLADLRQMQKINDSMRLVVINGATHDGERGAMRRPEFVAEIRRFITAR